MVASGYVALMSRVGGGNEDEDDEEYYFGMHRNINKLIAIRSVRFGGVTCRRAWDTYLVPRDTGRAFPPILWILRRESGCNIVFRVCFASRYLNETPFHF